MLEEKEKGQKGWIGQTEEEKQQTQLFLFEGKTKNQQRFWLDEKTASML